VPPYLMYTKENTMQATIVIDLGFGDAGKGTMVDYLSRGMREPVIVRFNGGAQAAHNVVTPRGVHHTFSQFGSGTLVDGVRTFLSRFMLLDPYALLAESRGLEKLGVKNPLARVMVDGEALVVTPFHKAANRLREVLRGNGRHGSVGMGIGETMADMLAFPHLAVRAQDLRSLATIEMKCRGLQELKYSEFKDSFTGVAATGFLPDELRILTDPFAPRKVAYEMVRIARLFSLVSMKTLERLSYTHPLIFEGAQGVLIDEWHGFHPYTTWSTTTNANANILLREIVYPNNVTRLGVVRAYGTRHGPGPFPSENMELTMRLPDKHNNFGIWQGGFRVGWLDIPLTRYALTVSDGTESVALTHLDRYATLPQKRLVTAYKVLKGKLTEREKAVIVVDWKKSQGDEMYIVSFRRKSNLEDLEYQEMLGEILTKATPVVEDIDYTEERFIEYVSKLLSLPISVTSHGPTAFEKLEKVKIQKAA